MCNARKLCRAAGCDELAEPGEAHCSEHRQERLARSRAQRAEAKTGVIARAGAAFYQTTRWRKARLAFLAAAPLCRDCAELGLVVPATEVDHVIPHRGDARLMWDRRNWQPLCRPCHSRKTARETWHGGRAGQGA